jgi:hypothetical protein
MAIFQKIAASSFAAVRRTLKRRLLMLTLHEALLRDKDLDIEGRERLTEEARVLIHEEYALPYDSIGRSEVDRVLADLKFRLVKKLDAEALEMASILMAVNTWQPMPKKLRRLLWSFTCQKSVCELAIFSMCFRSSVKLRRRSCLMVWVIYGGKMPARRSLSSPPILGLSI